MTENGKILQGLRSPGKRPYSTWWLLVRDGNPLTGVLTVDGDGGRVLPAFSGEGEAQLYLWFGGVSEGSWHVRETSAGELVSLLSGPCVDVRGVALDPWPGMYEEETIALVSMDRRRFVGRVVSDAGAPGTTRPRRSQGLPRSGVREPVARIGSTATTSSYRFATGGKVLKR